MSKKILMIDGSYRKKNTYNVLLNIEQILKARGLEVEILNLFDYKIIDKVNGFSQYRF
jgi:multimeric flavodoxin WrbA